MAGLAVIGLVAGAEPADASSAPGRSCTAETISWSGSASLGAGRSTFDTGIAVPPAREGETVAVLDAVYVAYDEVGQELDRAQPAEQGERFALTVGGTQVGTWSADLPDDVSGGAASTWSSGDQRGSLGGGPTGGGPVGLVHASTSLGGPPDALIVTSLQLTVERCTLVEVAPTPAAPSARLAGSGPASGALPTTGLATWPLAIAGVGLMAMGAALVVAGRARRPV